METLKLSMANNTMFTLDMGSRLLQITIQLGLTTHIYQNTIGVLYHNLSGIMKIWGIFLMAVSAEESMSQVHLEHLSVHFLGD